jgi:transposase
MSKRERKSYDKAFKLMAVELYLNGKPAGTVAKELGIGVDMLRRWQESTVSIAPVVFRGMGNRT